MSRGRESGVEESRVRSGEVSKERGEGKKGAGVTPNTKRGYGGESMQKNAGSMKKPSF